MEIYDRDFQDHLKALGLADASEYIRWCRTNGFSTGIFKSLENRQKEVQFIKDQKIKAAFSKGKEKHKPTSAKLQKALQSNSDKVEDKEINQVISHLGIKGKEVVKFLNFLKLIGSKSKLLDVRLDTFIPSYPKNWINSPLYALGLVFKNQKYMIRTPDNWECETKNIYRQMSSLLRHCFTDYKIPLWLDSAWFSSNLHMVEWFLWIASGKNLRKADNLPITLSKMQVHHALQAPEQYNVMQALRYGQIMGMGGDKRLVDAVLQKSMCENFKMMIFGGM